MRRALSKRIALLPIALTALLLGACGGGGGGGGGGGNGGGGGGAPVTVSGRITFDRIPFDATAGAGLNPNAPIESPARHVVVEAIDGATQAALASTTTDANGDYTLSVPGGRNLFIRARAQMLKTGAAPTWDFSVRNNVNSDALYTLDGATFNSGTTNSTRNLRAASGWGGTSYTGPRAAAPFAILDTVYRAKELILTASANAVFPALNLFWSTQNRPASPFCPDNGNIGTSSYVTFGASGTDSCTPARAGVDGIYVLGDFSQGDTDEFDAHVIAHEFGHYFEDRFARSDSIGGEHGGGQRLDLRLAFGEGWGNAYSAMVQNDPAYRDSQSGMNSDFGFNLESDDTSATEGWFSEFSVGEILFDVFDATADSGDNVALGFTPIYAVMTGPQVSTEAMTSIFSFTSALRSANSSSSAAINALLSGEQISASDEFGNNEGNEGGVPDVVPIYELATFSGPITFCNRREAGTTDGNKLGNRKLFRMDIPSGGGQVAIQVTGQGASATETAAVDPDIYVFRRGSLVAFSDGTAVGQEFLPQTALPAGTHIVEIYDFDIDGSATSRCMSVAFTGI